MNALIASHGMPLFTALVVSSVISLIAGMILEWQLGRKVIVADAIWSAILVFLLAVPVAGILLPRSIAQATKKYIPASDVIVQTPSQHVVSPISDVSHENKLNDLRELPSEQSNGRLTSIDDHNAIAMFIPATILTAIAGTIMCFLWLGVAFLRCHWLSGHSMPCDASPWIRRLEIHSLSMALDRKVYLRFSADINVPLVMGWRRPLIILPIHLGTLTSTEIIDAVLLHELTHIVRKDVLRRLGWRVCTCIYWWNPLAWIAARRTATLQEVVCDGYCASSMANRQSYIGALFEVAKSLTADNTHLLAVPMARLAQFETRLHLLRSLRVTTYAATRSARVLLYGVAAILSLMVCVLTATADESNPSAKHQSPNASKASTQNAPFSSYSQSTTAANPSKEQQKSAEEGRKRMSELLAELSKEAKLQLALPATLGYLPPNIECRPLHDLRQLMSDNGREVSLQLQTADGNVELCSWSYADKTRKVEDVLRDVFHTRPYQLVFVGATPEEFLKIPLPGDWLFSHDPTLNRPLNQQELEILAKAIHEQSGNQYKLFLTQRRMSTYVATGDYKFSRLPTNDKNAMELSPSVSKVADGEFVIPVRRSQTALCVLRGFDNFLGAWAEVLGSPIVDQVKTRPIHDEFFVRYPNDKPLPQLAPLSTDAEAEVLKHFSEQTGLELTKALRQVEVIRVHELGK